MVGNMVVKFTDRWSAILDLTVSVLSSCTAQWYIWSPRSFLYYKEKSYVFFWGQSFDRNVFFWHKNWLCAYCLLSAFYSQIHLVPIITTTVLFNSNERNSLLQYLALYLHSIVNIGVQGLKCQGGGIKFRLLHTESTLLNTDLEILEEGVLKVDLQGRDPLTPPPLHKYDCTPEFSYNCGHQKVDCETFLGCASSCSSTCASQILLYACLVVSVAPATTNQNQHQRLLISKPHAATKSRRKRYY